jgi:alpha/beta superfamily hydrolase
MKRIFFAITSIFVFVVSQAQISNTEKIETIKINGGYIEGTLLSSSPKQKLAIIIAGSGPTDRNGNNPVGVSSNSYKLLAEELSKQNMATFRYDKRGIGKSASAMKSESGLTFDDYINDATAIFDYLKDSLHFTSIYFIGHSEGSLIGMIASQQRTVSGYISVSGAGRPIDVVIDEQMKNQPPLVTNQVTAIFKKLKQGQTADSIPPYLMALFRPSVQPYIISWLKHNPTDEIKKVTAPILIIQGTCDKQVKVEDAQNLYNANKKSTLDIIPNMTHVLKDTEANCADDNFKTYTDGSLPLNKQFVKDIVTFISK